MRGFRRACIALLFSVMWAPGGAVADDVAAFARLPQFSNVALSPDGATLAAIVTLDGKRAVYTKRRGAAEKPKFMVADDSWHLSWLDWVDNRYVLAGIKTEYRRRGVPTVETRLVAFDSVEGGGKMMFQIYQSRMTQRTGSNYVPQIQDHVLQTLPEQDEVFIVSYEKAGPGEEAIWLANARTGRLEKKLQRAVDEVYRWGADVTGEVRVGLGIADDEDHFHYRIKGKDGKWHDHSSRLDAGDFSVVALPVDGTGHVLVTSDHEYPLGALYRFDPESGQFVELVAQHDDSEINGVSLLADGSAIERIHFSSEFVQDDIRDPGVAATLRGVRKALPDLSLYPVSKSLDARTIVFRSYAPDQVPSYYLFDKDAGSIAPIAARYPELRERTLARPSVHRFEARDGMSIDAYVTLPPGETVETARGLPFVVNVHGGPNARDFVRFDWETQMLAARGYGVLQINFRGSTGYGRAFREAGDREWGQAMQDDITDGTDWLVAQGWGDPDRICITGGSYGGYAALMGAATAGERYRCAVSVNGVTDLNALLRRAYRYIGGRAMTRHIGRLWKDRSQLKSVSPLHRADDINVPVLLVHGDRDRVVDVRHSRNMRKALADAGKAVRYLELPDGTHSLEREANRLAYARALVEFLDTHLAPAAERAASIR